MNRDRFAYIFCGIVTFVWVIVLGVDLATKDYTGLTILTPLIAMVGGWLLGYGPKRNGNGTT